MKCPKCGYLGFETSERCRNCGYDFSLAVTSGPPADDLPLRSTAGAGAPLGDFDLSEVDVDTSGEPARGLDLDRVIGQGPGAQGAQGARGVPGVQAAPTAAGAKRAPSAPVAPSAPGAPRELPLFGDDDTPLITSPRPVRAPLSVRRTTPEIPRVRPRAAQPSLTPDGELAFHLDPPGSTHSRPLGSDRPADSVSTPASALARLSAALIDAMLLGAINAAVVYLTLALAGLTWQDYQVLPVAPLVGFFTILSGGYLIVFIAAAGQTIGKMVTGVRVVGDDGQRVDVGGAVLRTAGCVVSMLTLGLGYLPAFFSADRRAVQDRMAGTRVVRAR